MITLQQSTESSTSTTKSSLPTTQTNTTTALSFSELLQGVVSMEDGTLETQQATTPGLLLSLDENISDESNPMNDLKSMLVGLEDGESLEEDLGELGFKLPSKSLLSESEMKSLIADAKKFLENTITQSDAYKKSEIQTLPKTLKGLVEVAKKFEIDISKISLEEVSPRVEKPKSEVKISTKETMTLQQSQTQEPKVTTTMSTGLKESVNKETLAKTAPLAPQSVEREEQEESLVNATKKSLTSATQQTTLQAKTPTAPEITTQQFVATKLNTNETKAPKIKSDETLKLLLQGETKSVKELGFTADFSVATAKVIAPKALQEGEHSLESLLSGEKSESSSTTTKLEGLNVSKADSFEVKLNEAKQMTKYLSQDVKSAIEDYKSPFTRVKVQLNPQRFGEIDLTIVQRGKDLHINLSSNNAAINTLAMNATDLKAQLQNSGINNASLNFSDNSQNGEQAANQQQQHQRDSREAREEYSYFTQQDEHEEIVNSLEIVVPNYA